MVERKSDSAHDCVRNKIFKYHILSRQQVNFSLVNQTRTDKDSWEQPIRIQSLIISRTFLAQFGLVYFIGNYPPSLDIESLRQIVSI